MRSSRAEHDESGARRPGTAFRILLPPYTTPAPWWNSDPLSCVAEERRCRGEAAVTQREDTTGAPVTIRVSTAHRRRPSEASSGRIEIPPLTNVTSRGAP